MLHTTSRLCTAVHCNSSYQSCREARSARARGSGGTSMFPPDPLDSLTPSPTRGKPLAPVGKGDAIFPLPTGYAERFREKSLLPRKLAGGLKAAFKNVNAMPTMADCPAGQNPCLDGQSHSPLRSSVGCRGTAPASAPLCKGGWRRSRLGD